MNQYVANNLIRMTLTVTRASDGLPIDPSTLAMKILPPHSAAVDLSADIVADSVGHYHVDYLPTVTGLFQYEWLGTGVAQISATNQFLVNQGLF